MYTDEMHGSNGNYANEEMTNELRKEAEQQTEKEKITITFSKRLAEPFVTKTGKEMVRVKIPNADTNDHRPWAGFVVPPDVLYENPSGKCFCYDLPADGHTTISRSVRKGTDENGKAIWKPEAEVVGNRTLKGMVESYKNRPEEREFSR